MNMLDLDGPVLETVEMHTCGEPTRIVTKGYPKLQGTLLQQRRQAKEQYDHLRRRLMLEPRGHADMYGAILIQETELVSSDEADIGVLFCHCEGYSQMCGHGTIALGRFLIDTDDLTIFPRRKQVQFSAADRTASLNLHAPCGLVRVIVPTTSDGSKADGSRPVSFVSVPSFATALGRSLPIKDRDAWLALTGRGPPHAVTIDIAYGGAFYALVSVEELGLGDRLQELDFDTTKKIAMIIKQSVVETYPDLCQHQSLSSDQCGLYSVIIMDKETGRPSKDTVGAELGLCMFANGQIDRSPTGSGVTARVAAAYGAGKRKLTDKWTYHSLVSHLNNGSGAFLASIAEEVTITTAARNTTSAVTVLVEGQAFYLGKSSFISEREDTLGRGFLL
ncbi:putative proline racemase [Viridothelium virens]|uniref:trans-L-3-hydroxyproline dehydratase n=1 Tax=Viridothelium virens TaxID=1048519 RepID=A0A6A6H9D8_VIRVR|nr:putative proline racemase [Viridothelium virens]